MNYKGGLKFDFESEYVAWQHMKQRCYNSSDPKYKDYGARGIKVCQRWLNSFGNFLLDMGYKSSIELTLERKDNNGNYEPDNCEWATRAKQSHNTRQIKLTQDDVDLIHTLWNSGEYKQIELAHKFKINKSHISNIIRGKNWKNNENQKKELF